MIGTPRVGTVTIGDREWTVEVATTPAELSAGLGGLSSIPASTGMLFDLGSSRGVQVTTEPMLFSIDIIFIGENLEVIDVVSNIAPGYLVTEETPVRYFLEVNAGEAEDVEPGDGVDMALSFIQSDTVSAWMPAIIGIAGLGFVSAIVGGMMKTPFSSNPGNPGKSSNVTKHYSGAYLTNWQYGGYSYVEEDPKKPERLWIRGMADYVAPEDVIATAEKEGLEVSLAGGFWERIGYGGWGQKVSVSEAKRALAKAKEHALGPGNSGVSVTCPICGEELEVPGWDKVSRTDVLIKHLKEKHKESKIRGV